MSDLGYPYVPHNRRAGLEPPAQCPCSTRCLTRGEICGEGDAAYDRWNNQRTILANEWATSPDDLARILLADVSEIVRGTVARIVAKHCAKNVEDRGLIAEGMVEDAGYSVLAFDQRHDDHDYEAAA